MGNASGVRVAEGPIDGGEDYAGFWWRVGTFEKVLLCGRDPVGSVCLNVRRGRARRPWCASRQSGTPMERQTFGTEQEAIAFVEAAQAAYLAHIEHLSLHPPQISPPYRRG